MSLRVWLPLQGDLHNQGLANVTVTNYGATINNNGKIGQCYSFDGTNDYITISGLSLNNQWSYGCWVYSPTSSRGWEGVIILNNNGGDADMQLGMYTCPKNNVIQSTANGQYNSGISFTYEQWNHFFATFDGNSLKTYINGILINTKAITNALLSRSNLTIGARCRGTNSYDVFFNGRINDVRIYDHCLTDKEVEEIAKGLVLHYELNNNGMGGINLATNTAFPNSAIQGYQGHKAIQYNHSDWTSGGRFFAGYSDSRLTFTEIVANQPYTISAWVYIYDDITLSNGTSIFYRVYKTGDSPTYSYDIAISLNGITQRNQWVRVSSTFTSSATYTYNQGGTFSIGGYNGHFLVSMPKVELGTVATPWSPNPTDLNINTSIIYDSSGFNNNGELIGDNLLNNNVIVPKYNFCPLFNGTNNCIKVPYKEINPDGIFTLNLWFFKYKLGTKNYETLFGGPSGFEMDTRAGSATSLSLYMASTRGSTLFSPFNLNTWYMITLARDGVNEFYYVNGELKKTIEAKPMPNGIYRIGAWASDTGQNYYGNILDFRIYVTVLTAAQIKELYRDSMIVSGGTQVPRDLE